MADPTGVTVRLDGGVAVLCLDGAERMNAIGSHTYRALAAAVADVEHNGQTRAVVIHGAGRAFSAGADIEEMGGFGSAEEFRQFIHGFTDALARPRAEPPADRRGDQRPCPRRRARAGHGM